MEGISASVSEKPPARKRLPCAQGSHFVSLNIYIYLNISSSDEFPLEPTGDKWKANGDGFLENQQYTIQHILKQIEGEDTPNKIKGYQIEAKGYQIPQD